MANRSRAITELAIRNIGVIDQAVLPLGPGFNVITGETGAGKTMVLTGLNLLSGARADADLVRHGAERLSVSASVSFDQRSEGSLADLISDHSPEIEDGSLLLQRSISREGKGKAVVGSDPTTVSVLSSFAAEFFAIHGQGTNHRILDHGYQLQLLDRTSERATEAHRLYSLKLEEWRTRSRELKEFEKALKDKDREIASLTKFLSDLDKVKPLADEWEEINQRIRRLDSVEDLRLAFSGAVSALDDENEGAIIRSVSALRSLEAFKESDDAFRDYISRLRAARIELQEIAAELSGELATLEVEPGELDRLRERLAALKHFLQRYRTEVDSDLSDPDAMRSLIAMGEERRILLRSLQQGDDQIDILRTEVERSLRELTRSANELTNQRRIAASDLSTKVNVELAGLGLKRSRFSIELKTGTEFTSLGADAVEFLFTAHDQGKPLPLSKGASGGELSRVMLAIELALAEHREVGTLVFDEIDAGIGGEAGLIIGERLARLAKHFQIIVITHLAQVAVWAERHFRIEKEANDQIVLSSVTEVHGDQRVIEIARMLSGQSDSDVAQKHARELLKHANV